LVFNSFDGNLDFKYYSLLLYDRNRYAISIEYRWELN